MRFILAIEDINKKFNPKTRGIISGEEVVLIKETLKLEDLSVDDLRNLRDFAVLFLKSKETDDFDTMVKKDDKLSAIVHVIDSELFKRGEEVTTSSDFTKNDVIKILKRNFGICVVEN